MRSVSGRGEIRDLATVVIHDTSASKGHAMKRIPSLVPGLFCCGLALSSATAAAQSAVDRVDALNARCEAAREARLAPIREQKIAQCEASPNKPEAGCRVFYSTYGDNSNHANGSVVRGQFYGLPECVAARKATRRMNNGQDF